MFKTLFVLSLLLSLTTVAVVPKAESSDALLTSPLPPDTGISDAKEVPVVEVPPPPPTPQYPVQLQIPSISLNDKVIPLGTNSKGEMDVPDGDTKEVGWYKDGTVPGDVGSAVMDAHVYAAFGKLKKLKVGNSVYVVTDTGTKLQFKVTEIKTYLLKDVPTDLLFNRADTARLNLITCAGTLTRDHSTYTHRLIVYTELVTE